MTVRVLLIERVELAVWQNWMALQFNCWTLLKRICDIDDAPSKSAKPNEHVIAHQQLFWLQSNCCNIPRRARDRTKELLDDDQMVVQFGRIEGRINLKFFETSKKKYFYIKDAFEKYKIAKT
jgi:hypothetical protein